MSEAKPQDGSTVKGYRSLTETEIGAMNDLKAISRNFLAEIEMLSTNSEYDRRWLAIAKTDMQTACMAACRAVARPDADC
ncbi:hypothetical protein ACJ69_23045 [Enterobacter asburiae]|uniref:Acb2/Tad1 hairpin domain-containing protein n=1 Tax=Enterobacter asburiae TaxID=61645 RepID=A0A376FQB9_ENTAS|nr:hypothetical protein [Enterobacter asburiae]HCT8059029.1 hypothetical protein [Enterobacter hormaechei]AMA03914.1 hypothetical protein ACJ69_09765 [Enterobacter asburiae]AMA06299.1 hypothetical protein ACJ69_23045 [Enterobacter asburiae]QPS66043.1 hypothetical protein I6G49_13380 [Enterobacter asburiae]QPS67829.1 hypothetical protein I6G49_23185 [Enterobacter asburiae]